MILGKKTFRALFWSLKDLHEIEAENVLNTPWVCDIKTVIKRRRDDGILMTLMKEIDSLKAKVAKLEQNALDANRIKIKK